MTDDNTLNRFDSTGHLTVDALDEVATGASHIDTGVRTHLASCQTCSAQLVELQATVTLLRQMPVVEPPRSFVLLPERASTAAQQPIAPENSLTERLYRWLLPAMPALRSASVAAFLLFLTVTVAADRFEENENGGDFAVQTEPTTVLSEPVQTSLPSVTAGGDQGAQRSDESAAAPESIEEQTGEIDLDDQESQSEISMSADTAATDAVMQATLPAEAGAMEAAPAAAAPNGATSGGSNPAVASTQVSESDLVQATPSPAASEGEETQPAKSGDNWSRWRFAQVALLAISILLAALWIWLRRAPKSS